MAITPIDTVVDNILAALDNIPQTTDPATAKRQSIRAIVAAIQSMTLSADVTVNVPGTGLTSPSGAVTGSATGTGSLS